MQPITTSEKVLGVTSGVVVAVEALTWLLLSFVCLLYYYQDGDLNTDLPVTVLNAIYLRFLDYRYTYEISSQTIVIEPAVFTAFNIIYVVFDLCWLLVSSRLVYVVAKETPNMRKWIRRFFTVTHSVCILDLVLVVGLGIDHGKNCTGSVSELESELCEKAVVPVLVIAGKGFVLWILNVALAWACLMKDFGEPPPPPPPPPHIEVLANSCILDSTDGSSSFYRFSPPRYHLEYQIRWDGIEYSYGPDWVYR